MSERQPVTWSATPAVNGARNCQDEGRESKIDAQQTRDVEPAGGKEPDLPKKQCEAFKIIADGLLGLLRENKDTIWASMLKQTIKRKRPQFDESYFGYRTFSDLLEDAEKHGVIEMRTDPRSGTYVVTGFGSEMRQGHSLAQS